MESRRDVATNNLVKEQVPSPCSETVTQDLGELSLQPLPPIKERTNMLQLRLQQRRTREQLVEQGIMPPLKTPAAFHEQIRSLERARTGNFLKHKICSRPQRSELVRMHILQETQAEPSLQATQLKLKRARLADDLNEKIAQRPGPMELVVKNILPMDSSVTEAVTDGDSNSPKAMDVYTFDEDSSDALSPEQPASQESHCSSSTSPRESRGAEAPPGSTPQLGPLTSHSPSDVTSPVPTNEQQSTRLVTAPQPIIAVATTKPGPTLVKQSQPRSSNDKSRNKKGKEPKPRVKKLKYHQYIPPDQKQEPHEAPMDSAYARLLQQQQQFLQLQILSQQQQHYQTILPANLKTGTDLGQNSCPALALGGNGLSSPIVVSLSGASPVRSNQAVGNRRPGHLPASLDEMKVAELKMELKLRGLPVSGTKTDLIERLRLHQESSSCLPPSSMEITMPNGSLQPESMSLTPPTSPTSSEASGPGTEDSGMANGLTKVTDALSLTRLANSGTSPPTESPMEMRTSEKDQRLHEKERQIEELMRKLEQEQKLVEALKMQLEEEKRNQQGCSPPQPSSNSPIQVKEEPGAPSNCSPSWSPPPVLAMVKQEEASGSTRPRPLQNFPTSQTQASQGIQQPQSMLVGQPGPQNQSLPPSGLAANVQVSSNGITLQPSVSSSVPGHPQTLGLVSQKVESSPAVPLQCSPHKPPVTQTGPLCGSSASGFPFRVSPSQPMPEATRHLQSPFPGTSMGHPAPKDCPNKSQGSSLQSFTMQQQKFQNIIPKSKDPPRYEDAVKQTRSMQTAIQLPTATSQHMDDLFDVLIESGEIAPFVKQEAPSLDKLLPVTASVTTLPINTVLSRPPPQIQVAQMPAPTINPQHSLVALATDNQLETFLEGALVGAAEPRALMLVEELHSQLLDHPHSPMELGFTHNTPPSAFHLNSNNMDNMEWLDLTIPESAGGLNPLGISSPVGVFSSDFLESPDLQLNWE